MDTPALMRRPGAKIKGCGSALIKHLLADLINSSKHFTFSGVIATEISNLARLDGVNISAPMTGTIVGTDKTEVKNNTLTTLYNFSLDPGIYICEFQLTWSSNATGARKMGVAEVDKTDSIASGNIRTSYVQAVDSDTTRQHLIFFVNLSTTTKYAVRVQQTSGATLTTALRMGLIKLKDA